MILFIWGALTMCCAVASLQFLRFWSRTRERLFIWFAVAFAVLGGNWLALALTPSAMEPHNAVYLVRLLAFLIILAALVDQNRRPRG